MSEALAAEAAPHGIKTTIVEPGPFHTDFSARGMTFGENLLPEVYPSTSELEAAFPQFDAPTAGDPVKAVRIIIEAVESNDPPFRLPLGLFAFEAIEAKLERVKEEISVWRASNRNKFRCCRDSLKCTEISIERFNKTKNIWRLI